MVKGSLLLLVLTAAANAQIPGNLGFEYSLANGLPLRWRAGGDGFEIVADSVNALSGRYSLRIRWTDTSAYTAASQKFGVASQAYPVDEARGRRLRFRGYIRTESIANGYAGFWMRVDGGPGRTLAFDNMQTRGIRGTTPWSLHEIELPVDSGATFIGFGVLHPGDGTAWFDSLTLEVVGDAMPRQVAVFKQVDRPVETNARLLTDAELTVPADSAAIPEDKEYSSWIRHNARPVRSLAATDFSDLRFFAPLLEGKRIVQLGESGHGVAEFNMAKVRLIRYLHEELGFDVVAFESSTFECEVAQQFASTRTPMETMRGCIFPVWHTAETLPLFEYIKETQATKRPLILAGFDVQLSSANRLARPGILRALIAPVDSVYAQRVFEVDESFVSGFTAATSASEARRLVPFYDSLAQFLTKNRSAIEAAHPGSRTAFLAARQAAISMTFYVRQLATQSAEGSEIRDLGMANNLDFVLDELYPGKKVIVWAHNFHIQHRENTRGAGVGSLRTMGTWVAERRRKELYTIGLFMYRGQAAQNDRKGYNVVPSASGSLESILHQAPWRYSFVDFSKAIRQRGSEWMWRQLTALSWGTAPERMIPRDEYDGVLFIDTVHMPIYR